MRSPTAAHRIAEKSETHRRQGPGSPKRTGDSDGLARALESWSEASHPVAVRSPYDPSDLEGLYQLRLVNIPVSLYPASEASDSMPPTPPAVQR